MLAQVLVLFLAVLASTVLSTRSAHGLKSGPPNGLWMVCWIKQLPLQEMHALIRCIFSKLLFCECPQRGAFVYVLCRPSTAVKTASGSTKNKEWISLSYLSFQQQAEFLWFKNSLSFRQLRWTHQKIVISWVQQPVALNTFVSDICNQNIESL